MPRKKTIDWVVFGPEPHFATCRRCGCTVPKLAFPVPMDAFLKYTDYAMELHRHCQPPLVEAK